MYTVTGLEGYTDYVVKVYAENKIDRNTNYEQLAVRTLRKYLILICPIEHPNMHVLSLNKFLD